MAIIQLLKIISIIPFLSSCAAKGPHENPEKVIEVMFYNVENLFDTKDDSKVNDSDYTSKGRRNWTIDKYETKLNNLAKVIKNIDNGDLPDIIGLCEVENRGVVKDLMVKTGGNYAISHFDSPDARGIDVALVYNDSFYTLINEEPIFVSIKPLASKSKGLNASDKADMVKSNYNGKTRNILKTILKSNKDTFAFFTCHFPSRRGGQQESSYKREQAAAILKNAVQETKKEYPRIKILIMGDFNDEPVNKSIHTVLGAKKPEDLESDLYNLFYDLDEKEEGSYRYRGQMNMLDQFIISKNWWNSKIESRIFKPSWLIQTGKYAGYPLRTFGGKNYLAGYSDHFSIFTRIPLNN